jgi:HD domain
MTRQTRAGIAIPDTPLVRDTTEYIRDVEDDLLFDHSRRVFLFGALQGQRRGLDPDLELLYVGAMFHDIGLTADFRDSMLRFEVDGANAAEKFLRDRGLDDAAVRKVWLSIALHTTPGVPEFLEPEIALVNAGVKTDVIGFGRDDLPDDVREAIHHGPSTAGFQASNPAGIRRRQPAPASQHLRHDQRGRTGTFRSNVRPRRLRRDHPQQQLA